MYAPLTFLLKALFLILQPHCCRCAYVMVCELDENRLLAEMVLNIITRLIREYVTSLEQKNAEASQHFCIVEPLFERK